MDESLHLQLQKVSRNLIGLLRNSKVLCPTLEPSTYNSFCPIFFLYSCSLPLFLVCLLFPPSLTVAPSHVRSLACLQIFANMEFDCPAYFISTFAFVTILFFPRQDPVFLFKSPDLFHLPFISPLLPLQDLMLVWSVLFLPLSLSQQY